MSELKKPLRYPLKSMGGDGDNKQDMLYIKIFSPKRSEDIYSLDSMFETRKVKELKDGKQVENEYVTGFKPIRTRDDIFNEVGAQTAEIESNARYIYLPIPQQVTDNISVDYAQDTLNPLQAAGLSAASGLIGDPSDTLATAMQIMQTAAGTSIGPDTKKMLSTILGGKAINQLGANVNAQSLITRASGQVLQSNMELLFNGPTLRSFPFVFDFAPHDEFEAAEVMQIIRVMKEAIVPKKGTNAGLFINSPDLFQLEYITAEGREHPFLNKFKVGAVSDISVNYTASGTYATYGGNLRAPVHIQMSFTFKELNPIYQEDYDQIDTNGKPIGGVGF
jgi:hypothetical protein